MLDPSEDRRSVFALFSDSESAGKAAERLENAGFRRDDVSALLPGRGTLGIPGLGPFLASGPLLSALSGVGIGGTVGGIAGAIAGFGVSEYEARRYEGFVKEGYSLLSVRAANPAGAERAKRILLENGGREIAVADERASPKDVSFPKDGTPYRRRPSSNRPIPFCPRGASP